MSEFDEYLNHIIDTEFYAQAREEFVRRRLLLLKRKIMNILDRNPTIGDRRKLKKTLDQLDEITDEDISELEEELEEERNEQLKREDGYLRGFLRASLLASTFLSLHDAKRILNSRFNSKDNFSSFKKNLKTDFKKAYTGPLNSENHFGGNTSHAEDTISRNIDRIVSHAASDVHTMTTALQRDAYRNVVRGSGFRLQYVAMLDSSTCPVCGVNHGMVFDEDEAPDVPLHNNCRCVLVHVRGDGYTLRDYNEWLRRQPNDVQEKILGKTRYAMYRSGYISNVGQFTSKGRLLTLDELYQKNFFRSSGGRFLNKDIELIRQQEYADKFYEFMRKRHPTDISKISKNTKLSKDMIKAVRSHIFLEKHHLYKGFDYFDADPEIAHAWQRLEQNIFSDNDLLLLKHEYEELTLIKNEGYNINKAHVFATSKYPWEYKIKGWSDDRIMADINERLKIYL